MVVAFTGCSWILGRGTHLAWNRFEQPLDRCQSRGGIHVTDYDQDRIVGRVPFVVKVF